MTDHEIMIVCDAGPLIHLDEVESLHLLKDFEDVFIPEAVLQEVALHRPEALKYIDLHFQKLEATYPPTPSLQTLIKSFALDFGEQAALALMEDYPSAIFVTDDSAARLAAVTLGYKVHGSLGILIRSIRRNQMTKEEVVSILEGLPQKSTLHIRTSLLEKVINQIRSA